MALEVLFALTIAEMLVTQYIVVPAIGAGAVSAGIYVDVKKAQYVKDNWYSDGDPYRYDPTLRPGVPENAEELKNWGRKNSGDRDGDGDFDKWDKWDSYFSDWDDAAARHMFESRRQHATRDEPAVQEVLRGVNAAMWFHDTGMNEADLEGLRGMKIRPHPDESRVDRGIFEKDGRVVEGNFLGGYQPHVDGIRTGNFSAMYPGIGAALEGDWIVVNRTEASDDTAARFEKLQRSMRSAQGNGEASRKVLFGDLMQAAVQTQAEEQEQEQEDVEEEEEEI